MQGLTTRLPPRGAAAVVTTALCFLVSGAKAQERSDTTAAAARSLAGGWQLTLGRGALRTTRGRATIEQRGDQVTLTLAGQFSCPGATRRNTQVSLVGTAVNDSLRIRVMDVRQLTGDACPSSWDFELNEEFAGMITRSGRLIEFRHNGSLAWSVRR